MVFESARQLVGWARDDIRAFELAAAIFANDKSSHGVRQQLDSISGELIVKFWVAPVPQELCKLASHALWDVKHSLDHGMHEACETIVGSDPGDVHFLVASHLNDCRKRLYGESSKYPPELRSLIESFEIYPTSPDYDGGNDEFVALNKLANQAKHALALSTTARTVMHSMRGTGLAGGARIFPNGRLDASGELVLGVFPADSDPQLQFQFEVGVAFSEPPRLRGLSVSAVLTAFADAAMNAIEQLEGRTADVIAGRL
jgi:hypothetical protein